MVLEELQKTGRLAYDLALFLTDSPQEAWSIVEDAFLLVFLTEGNVVQRETQTPRKTIFTKADHLVQYFVLDFFERHQTNADPSRLSTPLQIKRYITYLIVLTVPHTAFHVGVAIMRLLFGYSNREALGIHEHQTPNATKDEAECSRAKSRWFKALESHFAGQLKTAKGAKGEKRFEVMADVAQWSDFVDDVLTRIAPWQVDQLAPGSEMFHIHNLIEPKAFRDLANKALSGSKRRDLRLPEMGGHMPTDTNNGDDGGSFDLEAGIHAFSERLVKLQSLKKKQPPRTFILKIDGVVQARFALQTELALPLSPWSRIIELWAELAGETIPLAYCLLPSATLPNPFQEQFSLGHDQTLTLTTTSGESRFVKVALQGEQRVKAASASPSSWWRQPLRLPLWLPLAGFATLFLAFVILPPTITKPHQRSKTTVPDAHPMALEGMAQHNLALAEALYERAASLAASGRRQEALQDLEAAQKLAPRNTQVLALLAQLLEETGDLERSRFYDEVRRSIEQK